MSNTRRINIGKPKSNTRALCANCGPKPIGAKPGDIRIGQDVKRAFVTPGGKVEHMWVHVRGFDNEWVWGHLNNDPVFADYDPPLERGNHVDMPYEVIEAIAECK